MKHDHEEPGLTVGDRDPDLTKLLDRGLDAYDCVATGTTAADRGELSVRARDPETGETAGGLTAWSWDGLLGIPGGAEDVHFHKRLAPDASQAPRRPPAGAGP
ncbi:hypothetical protein ABT117_01050 [Streptomyces sp. NPDC002262]|uniref:hypothetical protein n=1 Tax=Streptomyces sp. NPDC002262 TaxID=3154414 RepID=UPI003332561B